MSNSESEIADDPRAILQFWLGDGLERGWPSQDMGQRWFGGSAELDREIDESFGSLVRQACAGGLGEWEADALPLLALVILLDQFTRNVFRGSGEAFAGDDRAQRLVQGALDAGMDAQLPWVGRMFLLMPLMHAENLASQRRCVQGFQALIEQAPPAIKPRLEGSLRFANSHMEIIERFGRFPYRNDALGRTSSAAELEFLKNGPRWGQ